MGRGTIERNTLIRKEINKTSLSNAHNNGSEKCLINVLIIFKGIMH